MTKDDFSLKKDVIQIQKKMADLELTATELKEALAKFDVSVLDDLKTRVDDVEDLAMVENAAVIELKKMLESSIPQQKQEETAPQPNPEMEEKIKSLEEKIANIPVANTDEIKSLVMSSMPPQQAFDTAKIDQTVSELQSSLNMVKEEMGRKLGYVEERFSNMEHTLTSLPDLNILKSDLKHEILSSLPNYDLIREDLQSIIEGLKSDFDKERQNVRSMLDVIKDQLSRPLPDQAVEELSKIRNDWLVNNAKVETVQRFVENFSNELNNLKPILAKLETFDKLLDLHEEISEKLQAYKEFQDHIQDAVEKNEEVEKRIQREVNRIKESGKEIPKLEESLARMGKEMDRLKKNEEKHILEVITPLEERVESSEKIMKDLQEFVADVDKRVGDAESDDMGLQQDMSVFQGNMMSLEQARNDIIAAVAELQESKANTEKRIGFNENIMDSLQKDVIKSYGNLLKLGKSVETVQAHLKDVKSIYSEMHGLRNELVELSKKHPKKELEELSGKIGFIEAEIENIKSLKQEDNAKDLVNKIRDLEGRIDSLNSYSIFADQLPEVISRLVFIESRLVAFEGMMQDIPRYSPIVVE